MSEKTEQIVKRYKMLKINLVKEDEAFNFQN